MHVGWEIRFIYNTLRENKKWRYSTSTIKWKEYIKVCYSGKITHSTKGEAYLKKHIPKYEAVTYYYKNKIFKNVNQFLLYHMLAFFYSQLFWFVVLGSTHGVTFLKWAMLNQWFHINIYKLVCVILVMIIWLYTMSSSFIHVVTHSRIFFFFKWLNNISFFMQLYHIVKICYPLMDT